MTCNELWRILKKDGWYVKREGKGSHKVLAHPEKEGEIVFSDHGSAEMGSGLVNKILKQAELR
ncbi:type II toxin-antitoxin system HicA family toxin [Chitinophaga sp. Cy-1792]|uniref:type II toxin-antitoxin system HicA family toxin n=1 Tax=Chitinophaga sp. Cy-1792 TaxID=2608339 RepID=UPI0014239D87|nr:type II toxin-antitoxin system HicA family toxin [Chitinophaga sp. Cy-1792]NIG57390.1 type II toxin-antitoxin system HicA family toxin [Chitinophaga sp. Cy-1792]